jgi:hypothetical protein
VLSRSERQVPHLALKSNRHIGLLNKPNAIEAGKVGSNVELKGSAQLEEFSEYLKGETPRGTAVVIAAHFDERLRGMLKALPKAKRLTLGLSGKVLKSLSFAARIANALDAELISQIEHDDLRAMNKIRNSFAHELKSRDFDPIKTRRVESLKTWQKVRGYSTYAAIFPGPMEKLVYVAAVFSARLNKRNGKTVTANYDPEIWQSGDSEAWILVN